MKFYFSEVQGLNNFRKAEAFEAKDLTRAKILASKKQAFEGTVLTIGTEINEEGLIVNPIAVKVGKNWR